MKTLKHLLLIMIALASLGSAKAQCYVGTYAVPTGPNVNFYVDIDSVFSQNLTSFYWDFGDGDTAHAFNTQHTYVASGTYSFCFHAVSPGCTADTCYDVTVNACDFNPQITYTQQYNSYLTTFGVANPQAGATYAWTIYGNNGSTNTSTQVNPQYTFSSATVTSARVTVTLPNGCVDTALSYVYIGEPCGGGAHPYVYQTGLGAYNFQGDSLGTLAWNLGDGTTSTQPFLSHTYAASGTYIVCLTRDYNGCNNTTCDTLVVDLCGFTPSVWYTNVDSTTVQFYSEANSGQSFTSLWTVTGAIPASTTLQNPLYTLPDTGSYNYCVTIVSAGCTKTICDVAHVVPVPPVPCNAGFYYDTQASTAFLYPADSTPNRLFAWDFGDGNTSTNHFPQHSYTAAGSYTVCLAVSAANGSCTTNFCQTVTVSAPPCLNYFSNSSMGLGEINFTAYLDSINLSAGYHWDFGDGDTLNGPNSVTHFYPASGVYYACVTLTNSACAATICDTEIVDMCEMNIYPNYSLGAGYTATFNVPQYSNLTYQWTFEHGSPATSTAAMPTVTYPTSGIYQVNVTVTSSTGCVDSGYTWLSIPNPCHTYIGQYQLDSASFRFVPLHYDSTSAGPYTYTWNFDDGVTSTLDSPQHTYTSYGLRHVCVVTTGANCVDTACTDVQVAPIPLPSYYLQGSVRKGSNGACEGTVFLIRDSLGYLILDQIVSLIDSFGNGNCNGNYTFWAPQGNYYIKAALGNGDADYANYLPTYFGDVLDWGSATQIALTAHTYSQNINLIAGVNPGGPGFVGGYVTQGAGLAIGGGYDASRSNGDPIANAQINLLTDNDVPVAATFTDANGRYTFSNLAIGTYKVYAEAINKVPYPLNVTLTAANPAQDNVDVSINSNSAVTGLDDLRDIKLEGIYPNPVSDKTVVSIALKQNSKVKLMLTDVNGRLIQNRNLDLSSGVNRIDLDLTGDAAGIYHLSLTNDASKKIIKISKIK